MLVNKVEICGVNTAKLPVLSAARMRELFEIMQQGGSDAREQLIYGNLRLVLSVIQRFNNRGEFVDDLFQPPDPPVPAWNQVHPDRAPVPARTPRWTR